MRVRSLTQALTAAFAAGVIIVSAAPSAQTPAGQKPPAPQKPPRDVIRRAFDLIQVDVIARDANGQFMPDLERLTTHGASQL